MFTAILNTDAVSLVNIIEGCMISVQVLLTVRQTQMLPRLFDLIELLLKLLHIIHKFLKHIHLLQRVVRSLSTRTVGIGVFSF